MRSLQDIESIVAILNQEFPEPLPPLRHRNAFELLIAVILSAQCTDERVNQVTLQLFPKDKAATPDHILELGEAEVKRIIYPCGYYNSKTKAVMGTASALKAMESTSTGPTSNQAPFKSGDIPSDFTELRKLPGVGAKTAQVVQAQWFGLDTFPVDTHVHRVCNRLGLADSGKNRDKTERQVKASVPEKHWSKLHLQLIYHGRKTCTAYKPKCQTCPLRKICNWPETA